MKRQTSVEYVKRLDALRSEMLAAGTDVYYVPGGDFHMSEYISDYFKCREFLSGFDGSNGEMVITKDGAYLWTDGRYFLQAGEQLRGTGITLMKMGEHGVPKLSDFIKDALHDGESLGFDGRCVPAYFYDIIKKKLGGADVAFVTDIDLVGNIWTDRPALPSGKAWILDDSYTGMSFDDKLTKVREMLAEDECDMLVLSSLDDIAWLFGFRGNDIDFNPVSLSYAVITSDKSVLYMDEEKAADIKDALTAKGIEIKGYEEIFCDLKAMDPALIVSLDRSVSNLKLTSSLPGNVKTVDKPSPTVLLKACKTETEVENERKAHISDGAALTRILYYLKKIQGTSELLEGKITELDVAEKLLSYRAEADDFKGESFAPIVATGAHGAIIHYEPTPETNVPVENNTLILLDTGGHYLRGTTDVTRTVSVGTPSEKMKKLYTAVLKGNINLAGTVFKKGTCGRTLDILARKPLWDLGYDYNHGTGHGVGYLLNVHEGPQNISTGSRTNGDTPFEIGMITSDEPGVYLAGEFGIRTENMMVCVPKVKNDFGEFYGFETLTMVPFDRDLIDVNMLTNDELAAVNEYHKVVYETIADLLPEDVRNWLQEVTKPLTR